MKVSLLSILAASAILKRIDALKEFVTQRWTEIDGILNGAKLAVGAQPIIRANVREALWPVRVIGPEIAAMEVVVDSIPRIFVLGEKEVQDFCAEIGLDGSNCERIRTAADQLEKQWNWWLSGQREPIERMVCLSLLKENVKLYEECLPEETWRIGKSLPVLSSPGNYLILATEKGGFGVPCDAGSPQLAKSQLRFEISECIQSLLYIASPRHGSIVPPSLNVTINLSNNYIAQTCYLRVDNSHIFYSNVSSSKNTTNLIFTLHNLSLGRHRLQVSASTIENTFCPGASTVEVQVQADWDLRSTLAQIYYNRPRLITAVSERYVTQGILENLVGSIHYWEPAPLEVYNLGLSEKAISQIKRWQNVFLLDLEQAASRVLKAQFKVLPQHIFQSQSYAFKPIVLLDALQRSEGRDVLWLDANVELRRPLDDLLTQLAFRGHFLIEHPFRFPTRQFHHPTAVANLGCSAPDFSRQHCATTIIGVRPNSWFATQVVPALVHCAANLTCINPPGSSRANHRQEQTALNAILCRLGAPPDGICTPEKRFRLTSDFENDHDNLQPTADESDWNELCLYTRRDFPIKPYRPYVKLLDFDNNKSNDITTICPSSFSSCSVKQ
uniref:Uncharacterized protein n=1 Tax=Aureoumbra lagunensis TaxID=44058 RepID=A0A7S3NNH2_9STRA